MRERKAQWEDPAVLDVGDIETVVQKSVGGGKTVVIDGDPGEPQKNDQQDLGVA